MTPSPSCLVSSSLESSDRVRCDPSIHPSTIESVRSRDRRELQGGCNGCFAICILSISCVSFETGVVMEADGVVKMDGGSSALELDVRNDAVELYGKDYVRDFAVEMDAKHRIMEIDVKHQETLELIRLREEALADKSLQLFQDFSSKGRVGEIDSAAKFHDKTSRLPRWSRHETLVLVEAKKAGEARMKKKKEEKGKDERGREKPVNESKWLFISAFCKQRGVDRESNQCRKRWGNLFGDYKRIKEWQKGSSAQSFWLLKNNERKDSKLPGSFDPEVFEALEIFSGRKAGLGAEAVLERGRPASEEGLFSDIEHPVQEEEEAFPGVARGAGSSTPHPDLCKEQPPTHGNARKKRKRTFLVEPAHQKDRLVALLESNCRVLSEHIVSQNRNFQLERIQRKEQVGSLVSVLGKLADALEKISENLQKLESSS